MLFSEPKLLVHAWHWTSSFALYLNLVESDQISQNVATYIPTKGVTICYSPRDSLVVELNDLHLKLSHIIARVQIFVQFKICDHQSKIQRLVADLINPFATSI